MRDAARLGTRSMAASGRLGPSWSWKACFTSSSFASVMPGTSSRRLSTSCWATRTR